MEVIPAFLVDSATKFTQRISAIETLTSWAQIDVLDGTLFSATSWADPEIVRELPSSLQYELHLMVSDPLTVAAKWKDLPAVKRVLFHLETVADARHTIGSLRAFGWEVGVALNPETPVEMVLPLIGLVDEILFLTVSPGAGGRPFVPSVLEKIKTVSALPQHPPLAADGGISCATGQLCRQAGATRLTVNSALFRSDKPIAETWASLLQCLS